ncbi:hypothetical protein F511_03966 [Dorcoceras hygrometricum]|uniref:Uncharacterized protein n=1 Tax=Dorcoceras hygrometricum TaxID=472368 RepID=A0A2Z7B2N2_9LAMI|nr:hypothetical protein F511_03966 [Dorcoceras hygrometricum]
MVKRLERSPHDPLGITDGACKNQLVMVSIKYSPFNSNIPIISTTIGKSRVARDPIIMHTSWRSNSDIACVTRRRPKINQLEHNQPADDEDQLQALKSEVNQLELELRSLLKKAIEEEDSNSAGRLCVVISADEATVSSRNAKISSRKMNSRRKQQQHPVESLFVSAVATQPVASLAYSVDLVPRRKELKKKQSVAVVVLNQQRSS